MTATLISPEITANNKLRERRILTIASKALTTAEQQQDVLVMPNYGMDLDTLRIKVTVDVAGTLSNQKNLLHAIKQFKITDRFGKVIIDNTINGGDLPFLARVLNNRLVARTPANVSNSTQTHILHLPVEIKKELFPISLDLSLNSYTALATGATGANVAVAIDAMYLPQAVYQTSRRIRKFDLGTLNSGTADIRSKFTTDSLFVTTTLARFGTPANVTNITFQENGNWEVVERALDAIEAMEAEYGDGSTSHVTGEYPLFVSPYEVTNALQFSVVCSGSTTMELILVARDRAPPTK